MPRVCTVCAHAERRAIDTALVTDAPNRRIATQYGLTEASVRRHKSEHIPVATVAAQDAADLAEAETLLERLKGLNTETRAILRETRETRDHDLSLKALARLEKQLELEAKLLGELNEGVTVNLSVSPEWVQIRALILQAVTPYPEAAQAVVGALSASERLP